MCLIENRIDEINVQYLPHRQSCRELTSALSGFFPPAFLENTFFVLVDEVPAPDLEEVLDSEALSVAGNGTSVDDSLDGVAYKDTYYIRRSMADDMGLHFHELVHIAQWQLLGAPIFIERYLKEVRQYGYDCAPLEAMAYALERYFAFGGAAFDVLSFIHQNLTSGGRCPLKALTKYSTKTDTCS